MCQLKKNQLIKRIYHRRSPRKFGCFWLKKNRIHLKMPSIKKPRPLATNPFLSHKQKRQWSKLLDELSLGDGLEFFLEWENQFLRFGELVGSSEQPKQYVDCQLLNLLE